MKERTFDDFDDFAKEYRSIHTQNVKLSGVDSLYFAKHKVLQLKNTESDNAIRMLDIGCGDGATEVFIQENFPSWQVEGIDVSTQSIEEAQSKKLYAARFQLYGGVNIPFDDSSFEVVFIAAVLHHIDFSLHPIIIKEIYRVLKPGGRLYLFEHNPLNPVTKHLVKTCVFDKNARLLSYAYTKKIIQQQAFTSITKKFILFFPRKGILSKLVSLESHLWWLPLGGQYYFRAVK